jgi:hypothetical protein
MSDKEKQLYSIIEGLLRHKDTNVLVCPSTGRYFIMNENFHYYSKIQINEIKVTNHRFYYVESIEQNFFKIISQLIDDYIKQDRDRIESEMFKNENQLLNDIKSKLNIHG